MTTDNKQSVLTDDEIDARRVPTGKFAEWESGSYQYRRAFARAIESAVLSKLRGAGEPVAWMTDDGRTANAASRQGMHEITKASFCIPLYAAPQGSAEVRNAALEEAAKVIGNLAQEAAKQHEDSKSPYDEGFTDAYDYAELTIRSLKSAPAAEDSAKVAGDVELPKLPKPQNGRIHYVRKDIIDYARAAVLADRQQRDDDLTIAYLGGAQAEKERQRRDGNLIEALRPFAAVEDADLEGTAFQDKDDDTPIIYFHRTGKRITIGDFRRASAALSAQEGKQ